MRVRALVDGEAAWDEAASAWGEAAGRFAAEVRPHLRFPAR
jgi:hypothetical protein